MERIGGHEPIRVDVRVIAASNQALPDLIAQGRFREDLFYRLNVIPVEVPPLRRRREDIPLLVEHFLKTFSAEYGKRSKTLSGEAMGSFMVYDWPGNVRELRNMVERLVIMTPGDVIAPEDLPPPLRAREAVAVPAEAAPPEPAGGPGRFRARVHPRRAPGPRLEHHPDRPGARHRAREPLAEAQGLRHRRAPEGRGAHPARCLRPAGLPPWGAAGSSLPPIRSPPSPDSTCSSAAAPPSTRPSPSARRSPSCIRT